MTLVLLFRPAAGQREPRFSSQGNLLPVPTLVRDASGNAVYGLHAQDFIVPESVEVYRVWRSVDGVVEQCQQRLHQRLFGKDFWSW